MDVTLDEAKNRLPELIHAVEEGERVVITRQGKPVAQIMPLAPDRREVRLGTIRSTSLKFAGDYGRGDSAIRLGAPAGDLLAQGH
jgi:prevent-host-death family protein